MTANPAEPGPPDEFLPPSPAGAEAVNLVTSLVAGVIEHLVPGASGLGGVVSAGVAFVRLAQANMKDAGKAFAKTYEAHRQEFRRLEERVRSGEIEQETLHRRLTMTQRALHEAGRHPDHVLREALGAFGARVLLLDLDSAESFEIADALSRFTALDFDYLATLNEHQAAGKSVTMIFDGKNSLEIHEGQPGFGSVPTNAMRELLLPKFPGLTHERLAKIELRLLNMGLIEDRATDDRNRHQQRMLEHLRGRGNPEPVLPWPEDYGVTPLGKKLLELASA